MHTVPADPLIGRVLEGRYRIRTRLAVGGMSTVYEAVDDRLERAIAVKVMASSLSADPVFVDRFSREARTAARLSHVNAVSVYDQGQDSGHVFLVMELVRGRTLRDLLRERGRLSPAEAVSLLEPVLAALAAAHRAGLVHRDVKPENILLSDDGVVKVADFGLARAVESNAASTRTGLMMGTVAYSSPEQFRGSNADIRSDVYSAGIVLFELLTGSTPYAGPDAMAVAYQHVHTDVPAPSTRQRGIAPQLDALVQRATARDPARRPADAGAFLGELHDVRRELRLPVMPVPRRPRPARPSPGWAGGQAGGQAVGSGNGPGAGRAAGPADSPTVNNGVRTVPNPRPNQPANQPSNQGGVQHTMIDPAASVLPAPAPAPPGPSRPKKAERAPRRRRRWLRTTVGALVLILLCAVIIYGSWWYTAGRYASIPDVRDRTVSQATAILQGEGFAVLTQPAVPSDTVAKGNVVQTDPATGARLVQGRTVKIIPSSGPVFYPLPDVRKQSKAAANENLAVLAGKGIKVTYSDRADDTIAAGSVVTTDPPPGTQVKQNDTVVVYVSTGPPIVPLPDVSGQPQAQATATLTKAGFKIGPISQAFSDTVGTGLVISQTPGGPSQQRKLSTVALTVSKGPDVVTVPSLPALDGVSDATSIMQAAGLQVTIRKQLGGFNGVVVTTDPGAGTVVKRGTTVTLYVV